MIRSLLRFPLFYKILIANAVLMGAAVFAAGALVQVGGEGNGWRVLGLFGLALMASVATNAVILRLALQPVKRLQEAAERVHAGDMAARAESSRLADRELERLTETFNSMLASSESYRRRLRETAQRALAAQEEERKRIAQELHDGIAQTMAALRVRLRVARALEDSTVRDQLVERVGAELGEAIEEVRRIAQGLRPPALDMLGLAPAIESCARGMGGAGTALELDVEVEAVEGLLSPEAELVLYRIVQEALSNASRHAGAARVRVRLGRRSGGVEAVVEDDGRGFDVAAEMSRGGLGLFGMQERAGYVGGTVNIESSPDRGTTVRATIPVVETARYA
ncbi:MAG TPA: ATP-binding protein [Longimicrobiales bacterium]|nr:ATP-binding protein [Longimicrobiales bacterium]